MWLYAKMPDTTMVTSLTVFVCSLLHGDVGQFLPCNAMHKCGICRHAVSVRLSVTFVSCAKTNKDIFEIFLPCDS